MTRGRSNGECDIRFDSCRSGVAIEPRPIGRVATLPDAEAIFRTLRLEVRVTVALRLDDLPILDDGQGEAGDVLLAQVRVDELVGLGLPGARWWRQEKQKQCDRRTRAGQRSGTGPKYLSSHASVSFIASARGSVRLVS